MNLTTEFKQKVRSATLEARGRYSGSDAAFAKSLGINTAAFSRFKKGDIDKLLSDSVWLTLAREYDVTNRTNNWKTARTKVYDEIEANLNFCKSHSKAMILIDNCGIGKTHCAKQITRRMQDAFYVDCSQGKTKQQFVRMLAQIVGIESKGRYIDVKNNLKYYLNNYLERPVIVLDDAGYLDNPAFLEIQELWNATEDSCGWYMIGDDSLQYKIQRGINSKKIGFKAIFSRFSDEYIHITPTGYDDKQKFLRDLIEDVAKVNLSNRDKLTPIVKKTLTKETTLRYLKTIIQINA